jgi:L-cystine uptake protein TcyP (sodium:dicarboxylate symporter family)
MLSAGLVIGIVVEWLAVHLLARWNYTDRMPIIPWIGIGWVPVLQMVVLPPLIFVFTAIGRKVSRT